MNEFVVELARGRGPLRATGVSDLLTQSWIAGDVRLDDRRALSAALGGAGRRVPGDASDITLLRAAWLAWGERTPERLRGDFSFALWDAERRVLFCARDPLGVRPLYWAETGDRFVCGNALHLVRAGAGGDSRLHPPAIASFLRWGFNRDFASTSFAGVRRLAPAHAMVVPADASATAPRRYWSFPVPEPLRLRGDEYVERFRDVLGVAVRDRLRTPRAAILLSGGLDSTSLAATARRVASEIPLRAWTNDPGETLPADECRLAAAAAARLGIPHEIAHERTLPWAHLADPAFRTPEPLDNPEWGASNRLLRRIAPHADTLIIGEDGDALFQPPGLLTMLRTWPPHEVARRVVAYTLAHGRLPHVGLWLRRRLTPPFRRPAPAAPPWIRPELLALVEEPPAAGGPVHPTRPDAYHYLSHPVWQGVLEPSQPAWTGVPVDFVWPLLDARVIEFVFSIPPIPWCQRKAIVRRAFRGELPDEVLRREKSPLRAHGEWQLAQWRGSGRHVDVALGEWVGEFVDTRGVVDTLQRGSVGDVFAAGRVLALDQWLRSSASSRAG